MPVIVNNPKFPIEKANAIMLAVQETQWKKLDVIAQNLSNASSPGYKEIYIKEIEKIYKTKDKTQVSLAGSFGTIRNTNPGTIIQTGNNLNIAITTKGYFKVRLPNGNIMYTRDGRFAIDSSKRLTTIKGHVVLSSGDSEISLDDTSDISFSSDGTVLNKGTSIGKIGIFEFDDEQELTLQSDNLLSTSKEPNLNLNAKIASKSIEESNVNTHKAMIELISAQRLFEQAQKISDEYEQIKKKTINMSYKNV